jgi:hypothetical protein
MPVRDSQEGVFEAGCSAAGKKSLHRKKKQEQGKTNEGYARN